MSYCKEEGKDGKDRVIFVTKEDYAAPGRVPAALLEDEDDDEPGLIMPDGSINWSCPCLGGMATGPCGPEFREAFSCFHYSTEEPKGADCFEQFNAMHECMGNYPDLYDKDNDDDEDEVVFADEKEAQAEKEAVMERTEVSKVGEVGSKDSDKNL